MARLKSILCCHIFVNMEQTPPLFVYFRPFPQNNDKYSTKFEYNRID